MPTVKIARALAVKAAQHADRVHSAFEASRYQSDRIVDLEILVQQRKKYMPKVKPRQEVKAVLALARVRAKQVDEHLAEVRAEADTFDQSINRIKAWEAVHGTRWPYYKVWPGAETDPLKYELED